MSSAAVIISSVLSSGEYKNWLLNGTGTVLKNYTVTYRYRRSIILHRSSNVHYTDTQAQYEKKKDTETKLLHADDDSTKQSFQIANDDEWYRL